MTTTSVERVARLLTMVPWLSKHPGISMNDAAAHFGITKEELEKDLWQVIVCGLPGYGPDQLVDIDFWENERIHVWDPLSLSQPLRLSTQEALSLIVGLSTLRDVPGIPDRELIDQTIDAIGAAVHHGAPIDWESAVDRDIQEIVEESLTSGRGLAFTYAGITADVVTARHVAPQHVEAKDGFVYLHAWCTRAQDVRTFRLDRVSEARLTDLPQVGDFAHEAIRHRATIAGQQSGAWLLDRLLVRSDLSESNTGDADWCVEIEYADPQWVIREIMGAAGAAWVVEPPQLREQVALEAVALAERYADKNLAE